MVNAFDKLNANQLITAVSSKEKCKRGFDSDNSVRDIVTLRALQILFDKLNKQMKHTVKGPNLMVLFEWSTTPIQVQLKIHT